MLEKAFQASLITFHGPLARVDKWDPTMHRIRVYVDTSVFGGVEDEEFSNASRRFFRRVAEGEFTVILSTQTLRELEKAPDAVQRVWKSLPPDSVEMLALDAETADLAQAYVDANVLSQASEDDALHVAGATVAAADLILSWNFRHIVNFGRIRGFNGVNVMQGYRPLTILSPMEVAHGDDDQDL